MRIILIVFCVLFIAGECFALSEKDYQRMLSSSPEFKRSDKILNSTWKSVTSNISKKGKKDLLEMQREWLKEGRDESAREYMDMGYTRDCAYAKATRRWAKNLEVYAYNLSLSPSEYGRAKTDDAFWDEDDDDIPPHCQR